MKATIEIKETPQGNVEMLVDVPAGVCTVKEKAYMEEFIATVRAAAPHFGKARGATALVMDPDAKPANQ